MNPFGLHLIKSGKLEKQCGRFLAHLKDDRGQSDYEVFSSIDEETARQSVEEAKEFVSAVERYVQSLVT